MEFLTKKHMSRRTMLRCLGVTMALPVLDAMTPAATAFARTAAALEAKFGPASNTKIAWRPKSQVPVTGDAVTTLMKLLDALNEDDDVQDVYSNEEISDEEAAKLG